MPSSLNLRLGMMMFLNYVIWGAWYVTLNTYLTATLHFTGTQAGAIFGTAALACMISPFFVGLLADRLFATEHVLAGIHLIGAGILYAVAHVTSFSTVYGLMLLYCLVYFPTIALTNSITFRNIEDPGKQFPLIRVMGTLGWIAIGIVIGRLRVEASADIFLIAAGVSIVMALFCLTLPHTPPGAKGQPLSVRTVLGLDALVMLKDRSFLIFVIASVLACIPLTFYFSFTNTFLNEVGVTNAAGIMTLGQASEVIMMLLMPLLFRVMSLKSILLMGLAAWSVRYALLAYGNPGAGLWMFYLAILLHGVCYDFFFMTGQLYTDQQAPARLRGTAQGFITFLTYGVGMFLGSLLSGGAVDFFTTTAGEHPVRNWTAFWMTSACSAAVILLLLALFFRGGGRIQSKPDTAVNDKSLPDLEITR